MAKQATADVRKTVTALVGAAASGRRDLGWLASAIKKAGYVPAADAPSRTDVRAVCRRIVAALLDAESTAESPCCKACLRHAIDALSALATGK